MEETYHMACTRRTVLSIRQNHIAQVCEHVFPECTWYYADSDEVQGGGDVGWGRSPTQKDYLYTYSNMRQSIYVYIYGSNTKGTYFHNARIQASF